MALFALVLLLTLFFVFAWGRFVGRLRAFVLGGSRLAGSAQQRPNLARSLLLAAALVVPYLLAALPGLAADPVGFLRDLAILLAYLLLPTLLLALRPLTARPLDLFDLAAILLLWLPIEFDLLPGLLASIAGAGIPLARLAGICLGFLLFLVIRPAGRIGYTYHLTPRDVLTALAALLAFSVVGLPFGVLVGFIQPGFAAFDLPGWLFSFIAIYFFTAVPEELLFRGVIQNLIEQRWGRTWVSLAAAALIFGLSHINNSTAHHAPPNWPYVVMATLAGLAYGWVWRRREKITASAITHTLVNFIWGVVFRS